MLGGAEGSAGRLPSGTSVTGLGSLEMARELCQAVLVRLHLHAGWRVLELSERARRLSHLLLLDRLSERRPTGLRKCRTLPVCRPALIVSQCSRQLAMLHGLLP